MFYARGVSCCAELRSLLDSGPDGGHCPADAAAECRGFSGDCAALAAQFATVPVLPDYPSGLEEYTCHAFPDDNAPVRTPVLCRRAASAFASFAHRCTKKESRSSP
jgi:hypothetical protein